jgi:hypothetical protein
MTEPQDQAAHAAAAATAAADQEAAAARNHAPSNEVPKREASPAEAAAAAGPCEECAVQLAAVQRVARAAGYLALICAAAVLYLLWADAARELRGQEGKS